MLHDGEEDDDRHRGQRSAHLKIRIGEALGLEVHQGGGCAAKYSLFFDNVHPVLHFNFMWQYILSKNASGTSCTVFLRLSVSRLDLDSTHSLVNLDTCPSLPKSSSHFHSHNQFFMCLRHIRRPSPSLGRPLRFINISLPLPRASGRRKRFHLFTLQLHTSCTKQHLIAIILAQRKVVSRQY